MWYKKVETYTFKMPREYKACLKFKENLTEAGVDFTEREEAFMHIIETAVYGKFEVNEDGSFDLGKR